MLYLIRGKALGNELGRLHLDVGFFVLEVMVPTTYLPKPNSEVKLYTSLFIREENLVLYGFPSEAERKFFQLALTVPGVGPKLAMSLLSGMALPELSRYLQDGNTKALEKIPGVGKKLAQRLVGDLKDKAAPFAGDLGLSPHEARKAVESIPGNDHSVDELVNLSLKKLGTPVS